MAGQVFPVERGGFCFRGSELVEKKKKKKKREK
jgi:hypothetical protein